MPEIIYNAFMSLLHQAVADPDQQQADNKEHPDN
jgi:hypothetical protein